MTEAPAGWVSKTHRAIPPFELIRPESEAEALEARAAGGAYLAGGIDQIQAMRDGVPDGRVIALDRLDGFGDIALREDTVWMGAGVTHHQIETDSVIAEALPGFAEAWATVGNIRVRMAGTIGGNLMAGNKNYDGPVLLAAVDASVLFAAEPAYVMTGADSYWEAPPEALLINVAVESVPGRRIAFDRTLKPAISLALTLDPGTSGGFKGRAAVGCAHQRPVLHDFEISDPAGIDELASAFADGLPEPITDAFASGDYRRRMAGVLFARHLRRLMETAA